MAKVKAKTTGTIKGAPEDRVKVPGWYHVHATEASIDNADGTPIEGWRIDFAVFPGQPEAGKSFIGFFNNPDPTKDENDTGNRIKRELQTACVVAMNLANESAMSDGEFELETDDFVNRQCVLHIAPHYNKDKAEKGFMQIAFADMLHVDDPRVDDLVKAEKVKLNQDAIKLLPASQRRDPKSFDLEKLGGKKPVSTNGNGSHVAGSSKQSVASNTATSGVNLDDV